MTPGNISRRTRSDATRAHVPSVLRIDVTGEEWAWKHIEVPHEAFDDVFHEAIMDAEIEAGPSSFVTGLAQLQARRTATGEGLISFLDRNLDQFEPDVAAEIRCLAEEVYRDV